MPSERSRGSWQPVLLGCSRVMLFTCQGLTRTTDHCCTAVHSQGLYVFTSTEGEVAAAEVRVCSANLPGAALG